MILLVCFALWTMTALLASGNIIPTANFRTSKNIAFSTSGGGSSHHMWVFEILKELHNRGHNVSFFSREDQLRFANEYPMIKAKQVGGLVDFLHHPTVLNNLKGHLVPEIVGPLLIHTSMINYPQEFFEYQSLFESEEIDLVICDSFSVSCTDRAIVSNLPVIITTTIGIFSDFSSKYINNQPYTLSDPTTQYESLWKRFYRDYITIPNILQRLSKQLEHVHVFQRTFGLRPTVDVSAKRYQDVPKMINNVFGIETARAHSPFLHMVGPIMRSHYPSLDKDTLNFLDKHSNVIYIAFGQHASPNSDDIKLIMQTLLVLLEQDIIDGFIWARLNKDELPKIIETSTFTYSFQDITHHKDIYLSDWAPQYAILEHPSTSVFISHGGVGSLHEALYNRVRLFIYPFFGDQPLNARSVERIGIGKYIDASNLKYKFQDYQEFYKKLYSVVADPQNIIQKRVNRYSAYIQVSATSAVIRGADVVEESLFASDDKGKQYYRRDAGYDIHWIKRNNLDIYAVIIIVCLFILNFGYIVYNRVEVKYSSLLKQKSIYKAA